MSKTLVITDFVDKFTDLSAQVISFQQYLADFPKLKEPKTRVINLCSTQQYLSAGYYCSLLAEARQHKVLPSVKAINDISATYEAATNSQQLSLPLALAKGIKAGEAHHFVIMLGAVASLEYKKIAAHLFSRFALPLLGIELSLSGGQLLANVKSLELADLDEQEFALLYKTLDEFTRQVWPVASKQKKYRWDMAILVNPNEQTAPSDKQALKLLVKAAAKEGINAQLVTREQILLISRFDALFIRETTSIKSHTYELARAAEKEGLVVIDDPTSILRCCNKVFLHDAFSYHKVPSPKTQFVTSDSDDDIENLFKEFGFPMVLKLPESAFSLGVYKVSTREELAQKLKEMLAVSALVLVQEYLKTDYDWRIGVLNGKPLYACRYYMARNHWQIYNHDKNSESGGFDTLPTFEAPREVIEAALKACKFIGNGLYGVDIKQVEGKTYVIEVNDNPSLEQGVEDLYLGKELYAQIMQEFASRLEERGKK